MRFAFLFLVPAVAFSQPFIGEEIASAPISARALFASLPAPAIAMARDNRGVVIAWTARDASGLNRLYAARLDGTGHVQGAVTQVPTALGNRVDVDAPSIAKSATSDGFVIGWLERDVDAPDSANAAYCRLDAELNTTAPQFISFTSSAVVVGSGRSDWITENGMLWRSDGGRLHDPVPVMSAGAMVVTSADQPILIGGELVENKVVIGCKPDPGCTVGGGPFRGYCVCPIYGSTFTYTLRLMGLNTFWGETLDTNNPAQPAIQSNGTDALIVSFQGDHDSNAAVMAQRVLLSDIPLLVTRPEPPIHKILLGVVGPDFGQPRPDIATDGERYVVVWRARTATGDYDINGAVLDADNRVTSLSIAASAADERDPSVIFVGGGRFLVAYDKISGSERRLAGRFIDFVSRGRAVH
jgi:hypothetical protein